MPESLHGINGRIHIDYLGSEKAQTIYASHGFIKAKREELKLRNIPL